MPKRKFSDKKEKPLITRRVRRNSRSKFLKINPERSTNQTREPEMRDIFDKIYSGLVSNKSSWSNSSEVDFKKGLLNPIVSEKNVIFLGCGDFALGFSILGDANKVTGIDFSKVAIESAKKNSKYDNTKTELHNLDLVNEFINVGSADVIVDDYLSHCITENRAQYFKNVRSVMGQASLYVTFAVAWPQGFEWPPFVATSIDSTNKTQVQNGVVVRVLKEPQDLLNELSENGFTTDYHEVIFNPTGQPIFFSLNRLRS